MRSLSLILIATLTLGGCASTERFERNMDSHVGWDIDRLRAYYGYNYIERDLGEGQRVFTWVWTERGMRPGYQTPDVIHSYSSAQGTQVIVSPGSYFPPEYYGYGCEISFIIDAQDRVASWRAHGNGCSLYPGPERILQHGKGQDAKP